jgi:hypothetical protein
VRRLVAAFGLGKMAFARLKAATSRRTPKL